MSLPWQENVDSDQFHRDIEWDLGRTDYEPATGAYIAPWDRQGWGGNDVVLTPPRSPGNYVPPSRPAIQEGQRDYVYMPTEKEQWRIGDENKRRQAAAVSKDWRESRLPRSVPEEPKEKVYPDWRDEDVVYSRPVFPKEPREEDRRAYGKPVMPPKREKHPWGTEGDHDYAEKKEKWHRINKHPDGGYRVFPSDNESRKTRRPSLRDTLVGAMRRSWR